MLMHPHLFGTRLQGDITKVAKVEPSDAYVQMNIVPWISITKNTRDKSAVASGLHFCLV